MTEKELSSLYYLNIELGRIKKQIEEIKTKKREIALDISPSGSALNGMPKSPSYENTFERKVINRLALIEELDRQLDIQLARYSEKQLEYEKRKIEIENYINKIDDEELKSIFNYRCIERKSWEEIGAILFLDRRTVSKKYHKYIKKHKSQ